MSQKNPPGYPLPSGELGNDEIVCQLVYLPNRDEYWQAFLGALSYMATWRAWERDDDKRGKNAASNWREAFELTMECWRMTCLADLKSDVAAILALMQSNESCCIENTTYGDQTTYITIIIPGVGDDPTHYGETAVSDWEEWLEFLCFSANAWVDELVSNAQNIEIALSLGGLAVALMAYVFGAFNFLFMRGDLNTSTLMLRVVNMIAGYSIALFSDAADDIETARGGIVCAIMNGGDVAAAVESALSSGDAWDLLYQHIDYDSAVAIMYEGGDGENYLVAEKSLDCDICVCHHCFTAIEGNEVTAEAEAGATVTVERLPLWGKQNVIFGMFSFNDGLLGFCGPMKVIDTISVNDSIQFATLTTLDQDLQILDTWTSGDFSCTELIGQLAGETCAAFQVTRFQPSDGGCGAADITITMTYHDV